MIDSRQISSRRWQRRVVGTRETVGVETRRGYRNIRIARCILIADVGM